MSSYLDNLNYEQKQAVTADLGPILIVAGAGTGKTKTLTSRIIYLVEEMNLQPENILAITFTNKAADEMKERAHLMSNRTNGVIFGTYHSLCTRILKQEIKILGRNEDFNIIDDEDQNSLIKDIYHSLGFDFKELSTNLALKTIERIKNNEIDLATFYTYDDAKKLGLNDIHQLLLIKKIYLEYVKQMNEQNLLDFNDLLNFTRKILIEHDEIAKYYSNQFKYILVDEFQDTNIIQFEILNKLINNSNVFVVGDPDQTIYTWRGAYPYIFKDFLKKFPQTQQIILNQNYRCSKNILKVANKLIDNNFNRIKKNLITENDEGKAVTYFCGTSNIDEATYVCEKIKELITEKKCDYKDIAILYRSNNATKTLEEYILHHEIPYKIYGGINFFQRAEIKDMIAYLKLLVKPNDELSLVRIINVPKREIGKTTITEIKDYARANKKSFFETLTLSLEESIDVKWRRSHRHINIFLELLTKLINDTKELKLSDKLLYILKEINYEQYLKENGNGDKYDNVKSLVEHLAVYEKNNPQNTLKDFLNEISLYTNKEDTNSNKNVVSLMTVHYAKGTEFNVVFIVGLTEGTLPSFWASKYNDCEEERRIAFVAITRAKKELYLTASSGSFDPISRNTCRESRFIKEIGVNNLLNDYIKAKSISSNDNEWFDSNRIVNYANNYETKTVEFKQWDKVSHTSYGEGVIVGINGDFLEIKFDSEPAIKTIIKHHKGLKYKI